MMKRAGEGDPEVGDGTEARVAVGDKHQRERRKDMSDDRRTWVQLGWSCVREFDLYDFAGENQVTLRYRSGRGKSGRPCWRMWR